MYTRILFVVTMLLVSWTAIGQTTDVQNAFDSYMAHSSKDANFARTSLGRQGENQDFTWDLYEDSSVSEINSKFSVLPDEQNIAVVPQQTRYRGFIPGKGSFIEFNYSDTPKHYFYLYNQQKFTRIKELPSFRQDDRWYTLPATPPLNEVADPYAKGPTLSQIPPKFNGSYSDFLHYIHGAVAQSSLLKNRQPTEKCQVKLHFNVGKDGIPYDILVCDVPAACPQCGEVAAKLLYESVRAGTNTVTLNSKPVSQWIPAIQNGRDVVSSLTIIVPFGYDDDPANRNIAAGIKKAIPAPQQDNAMTKDKNYDPKPNPAENDNAIKALQQQAQIFQPLSAKARVAQKDGKNVLTLLDDNSTHIVYRPLPKGADTAAFNNFNRAVALNAGGWAEVTKDKSGVAIVKFFVFTDGSTVMINSMPLSNFKKSFYDLK